MKKIFKISSLAFLLFAGISCENDDQTIARAAGDPELLSPADGAEYVLQPQNASNEATTLVWNHADYSVQTEVNYDVEVALSGTSFATIIPGGSTTNRLLTWTVEALNAVALEAGLTPFTEGDLDVRIKASLGSNSELVSYSNVIKITVTPYTTDLPKLYVVGNFLNAGGYGSDWTPADAVPLAASGFGETDYEGYVYFNVASFEYKFLPTNTSFNDDYGDDGSFSGVLVQTGESNAIGTGAGYYRVSADTDALTYSIVPTTWGIVGFATTGDDSGWNNSIPLTYNSVSKKWSGVVTLSAGNFKFRANNAWDINLGGDNDDDTFMNYGGPDINNATAGTYLVELDLSNPREYTYSLTAQ